MMKKEQNSQTKILRWTSFRIESGNILFPQELILHKVKGFGNNAIHEIIVPNVKTIKEINIILEK